MVFDGLELIHFFFLIVTLCHIRFSLYFVLSLADGSFEFGALFVVLVVGSDAFALEVDAAADADIDVFLDSMWCEGYIEAKSCSRIDLNLAK